MEVGEIWGYQHHANQALLQVSLEAIGTKRPARVKVKFLDDDHEGLTGWVPPTRLKSAWADRLAYEERESKWTALRAAGGEMGQPSFEATAQIFEWFGSQLGAHRVSSQKEGRNRVTCVTDWHTLELSTGLSRRELDYPETIREHGSDFFPWPCGELVARRFIALHTPKVLDHVRLEDESWARGAQFRHGRDVDWYIEFNRANLNRWEMTRDTLYAWSGRTDSLADERSALSEHLLADARLRLSRTIISLIERDQSDLACELYFWIHPEADKHVWQKTLRLERAAARERAATPSGAASELHAEHRALLQALEHTLPGA